MGAMVVINKHTHTQREIENSCHLLLHSSNTPTARARQANASGQKPTWPPM